MLFGMTEEMFWKSTINGLKPYGEFYQKKQIELDRLAHRMGAYVYEAVGTALGNAFSKHNSKSYRDKPYMSELEEEKRLEHMTEEEKTEQVEKIFEMLCSGQK